MIYELIQKLGYLFSREAEPVPSIPDAVITKLRQQGYRTETRLFFGATGFSNRNPDVCSSLVSPGGETVNSMHTPTDVQKKFEADAKAAYAELGLPVPEIIPGSEGASIIYEHVEFLKRRDKDPHAVP